MNNLQTKKILMLTSLFYPDTFGGSGKAVYFQAQELARQGYEVTVLTRKNKADLKDQESLAGFKVIRYSSQFNQVWGKSLTDIFILPGIIKKLCLKEKFDLAIYYNIFQADAFIKAKANLPALFVFLASYSQELLVEGLERQFGLAFINQGIKSMWSKVLSAMERKALLKSDKIIVLSQFSKNLAQEIAPDLAEAKITIIPGGIDLELFKPAADKNVAKAELNLPINKLILLTVRRLVGRTGVDNLIRAISLLKQSYPDFLLLIAGSGVLVEKLQALAQELDLAENVKFLGSLQEKDLVKYYQAADLFILPTLAHEGFGLVTLEALACGLPVLGTPVGATPEILGLVDKSLIFSGYQPEDIYQGIQSYIPKLKSQDQQSLSSNLRNFVSQNYSWQKSGELLGREIEKSLK